MTRHYESGDGPQGDRCAVPEPHLPHIWGWTRGKGPRSCDGVPADHRPQINIYERSPRAKPKRITDARRLGGAA